MEARNFSKAKVEGVSLHTSAHFLQKIPLEKIVKHLYFMLKTTHKVKY